MTMDLNFWNAAVLRRQIMSSSPELRALESKIHACALARDNSAAVAEKEAQKKLINIKDEQYAKLVQQLDSEEQLSSALTAAEKNARMLETQRVLKDQIAEKAAEKAKAEAEKTIDMLSEIDEDKLIKKEREEQVKKKQESQTVNRQYLLKQSHLKQLRQKAQDLQDRNISRQAEEYNVRVELQKELSKQEEELHRLHLNQRELSLVKQIEKEQQEKQLIRDTRQELEVLEKLELENKYAEEKAKQEAAARARLKEGLDSQVRYKQEQRVKEEEREAEYRKLLLEVLAEDCRLDQLVAEARRRRQLDHRMLVEQLLEERRSMRAAVMRQQQQEHQQALQYEQLRQSILEEEEKQLLLKHAPQLASHLTPQLLARLRQLL